MGNPEILLGKSNGSRHTVRGASAVIRGDAIFLLFLVCSADLDIHCIISPVSVIHSIDLQIHFARSRSPRFFWNERKSDILQVTMKRAF